MLLNTNSVVVAYERTKSFGTLNQKQDSTRTESVEAQSVNSSKLHSSGGSNKTGLKLDLNRRTESM